MIQEGQPAAIRRITEGRKNDLPVFWGLLKKASRTDDIVYYRTDPDLSITDGDILLQGARPLYTEGGAKTGYIVFVLQGKTWMIF